MSYKSKVRYIQKIKMFVNMSYTKKIEELRHWIETYTIETIETKATKLQKSSRLMAAYSIVYELCNSKPSLNEKMLEEYKSALRKFFNYYMLDTSNPNSLEAPAQFSLEFSNQVIDWFNCLWNKYLSFALCLSKKVFTYLDRHYLPGLQESSLYQVAIGIFNSNVCHESNFDFFQNCYFKQLSQMREKKIIQSRSLFQFTQAIFNIQPKLINHLTSRYLQQTANYYKAYHQKNKNLSSIKYLNKIYNLYHFESTLIKMTVFINVRQLHLLYAQFEDYLIKPYTEIFVSTQLKAHGLINMFQTKNISFMKVVYQVYTRFEGFDKIRQAYYQKILQQGQIILSKQTCQQTPKPASNPSIQLVNELQIVDELYTFYQSQLHLLTEGFQKNNQLLVSLNNAIEKLISRHERFVSILYRYCSKSRENQTFEQNQQKITLLFGKISSKDEFIELYESELFTKYVEGKIDLKKQEQFVNYLNQICGSQLTLRLIKKIKDFIEEPQASLIQKILPKQLNMKVSVLSLHLWQKKFIDQLSLNVTLPKQLSQHWRQLQKNFTSLQPKKKLIPLHFQNKLLLQVHFNKKIIQIKCHLIQAAVIVFLASKAYCSQEELIVNLSLQKNILQSTIQSLETVPNLLLKTSLGDYIINWYFEQKDQNIDLLSKSPQTSKQISKTIKQDRQILVEAAIIKYIKRSKAATFQEIVENVVKTIKLFKPQPPMIKAAVDKLIKKGFLQQSENGLIQYIQ